MFSSNRVFANRFEVVLVGTPQEISDGLYDVDIYQALHNVNSPLERNIQVAHRVFTDYLESVEKVNGRFFVFYKKVEVTPPARMKTVPMLYQVQNGMARLVPEREIPRVPPGKTNLVMAYTPAEAITHFRKATSGLAN